VEQDMCRVLASDSMLEGDTCTVSVVGVWCPRTSYLVKGLT